MLDLLSVHRPGYAMNWVSNQFIEANGQAQSTECCAVCPLRLYTRLLKKSPKYNAVLSSKLPNNPSSPRRWAFTPTDCPFTFLKERYLRYLLAVSLPPNKTKLLSNFGWILMFSGRHVFRYRDFSLAASCSCVQCLVPYQIGLRSRTYFCKNNKSIICLFL